MDARTILEEQWPYLLTYLPASVDLEATAREFGALVRKRAVKSASTLLRLVLAYAVGGFSLRQTAAWAEAAEVASLSDVALLNRVRRASDWVGFLLGAKLAERASEPPRTGLRLRLIDATTVSLPGSEGTDWRVHLGVDARRLAIDAIEVTDASGGETLRRFAVAPGEVLVADAGYAHRAGLAAVRRAGGDFLIRLNWQNVPLQTPDGRPFDVLDAARRLGDGEVGDIPVRTAPAPRDGLPALPARLVAVRKTEAAAAEARARVLRERSRKGRAVDPRALEAAAYVFVLTSVAPGILPGPRVLDLYRFRWQIELAFKRLKGLLHLDDLTARDPRLVRAFLGAKLLAALLLDDFTERFLAISPWGFRLP